MISTPDTVKAVQHILSRPTVLPLDTLRLTKLLEPIVNQANAYQNQCEVAREWMDRAYKLGYKDK